MKAEALGDGRSPHFGVFLLHEQAFMLSYSVGGGTSVVRGVLL